jgi:hypothetical protein
MTPRYKLTFQTCWTGSSLEGCCNPVEVGCRLQKRLLNSGKYRSSMYSTPYWQHHITHTGLINQLWKEYAQGNNSGVKSLDLSGVGFVLRLFQTQLGPVERSPQGSFHSRLRDKCFVFSEKRTVILGQSNISRARLYAKRLRATD